MAHRGLGFECVYRRSCSRDPDCEDGMTSPSDKECSVCGAMDSWPCELKALKGHCPRNRPSGDMEPAWPHLIEHWEVALDTYKAEVKAGRAESYAMREALLKVADKIGFIPSRAQSSNG